MLGITLLLFLITGIFAGTLSGLLGIGGGVVIVPCLVVIYKYYHLPPEFIMHYAVGTSFACIIFTSFFSAKAHHKRHNIRWDLLPKLIPGAIIGVIIGSLCSHLLKSVYLELLLGIFLIYIGFRMFLLITPKPTRTLPSTIGIIAIAFFIGAKSGLLGIGGGAILIPWLTRCNVPMKKASGTSTCISFPIAIFGMLVFALTPLPHAPHLAFATHAVYWPAAIAIGLSSAIFAPLGAELSQRISTSKLKRIFALFLFIAGLRMIMPIFHWLYMMFK